MRGWSETPSLLASPTTAHLFAMAAPAPKPMPRRWGVFGELAVDQVLPTGIVDGMCLGDVCYENTHATRLEGRRFQWSGTSPKATLFSDSSGNFASQLEWIEKSPSVPALGSRLCIRRRACSSDEMPRAQNGTQPEKVVSTDPPYYDNIGYADLSDFFYVWLRKLPETGPSFPDLFATLAVPKAEELVATPYRHGNKEKSGRPFFWPG